MADAQDLKSWDLKKSCGFESRHRYQLKHNSWPQEGNGIWTNFVACKMLDGADVNSIVFEPVNNDTLRRHRDELGCPFEYRAHCT